MSASLLTVYTSSDASAPQLTGQVGSLIAVLDAVLVNGYGTKTAAGWTRPVATASNIASYKQGAGSLFGVVVNDAGISTAKEATITGWEVVAGVGTPVGSGSGQFPLSSQVLTNGHLVWRKSASADATNRPWTIYADSSTMYLFVSTGDSGGTYMTGVFGDTFALAGTADAWRCIAIGRVADNSAAVLTALSAVDGFDTIDPFGASTGPMGSGGSIGHYMARTWGGTGGSINVGKIGNLSTYSTLLATNTSANPIQGGLQTPNGPDNSYYLSPLWIFEPNGTSPVQRARLRGLWMLCHSPSSFSDGQTFVGGGDYAGKSFQIVKQLVATGFVAVETSNTVETN